MPDQAAIRSDQRRLRRILIVAVLTALVFFVVGFVAVRLGWWKEGPYLTIASIVGGIASLVGLLSLARPSITNADIEGLELDALARVSKIAQDLEDTKRAQAQTRTELEQLEVQKQQMAILVRKAALLLFLQERVKRYVEQIAQKLDDDKDLRSLVEALRDDTAQLSTLGEEVAGDPNADVLMEVLSEARHDGVAEFFGRVVGGFAEGLLGKVR